VTAADCRTGRCNHHAMRGESTVRQTLQFGHVAGDTTVWEEPVLSALVPAFWAEHCRNMTTNPSVLISEEDGWVLYRICPGILELRDTEVARIRWETP